MRGPFHRRGTGGGSLPPVPLPHSPHEPSRGHEERPMNDVRECWGDLRGGRGRHKHWGGSPQPYQRIAPCAPIVR
jgi:hypothetical protein